MAKGKTNAMRILDAAKIAYEMMSYEVKDGQIDGISVANKIGKDPGMVYKTLVAHGTSKAIYVFVIPVAEELNLKKAASAAGEKKIEMVAVKDIQKLTGYIRGGCSPVGMSKKYPTFLQSEAESLETMIVSGGKIGTQIMIKPQLLAEVTDAKFVDLIK
ncbi:Cys-tRNA(Pro) deacylase [Bacillus massiliigorillae]|uniref:Cys-tRNA(Pro) deacylase n=1 Tax=Bacillus massiliigorillae TaxID=1243664 RepID=UPI0003A3825F|nr:Cys-tRNA(Pro) deacylase [Bacillus massiliigorillae]